MAGVPECASAWLADEVVQDSTVVVTVQVSVTVAAESVRRKHPCRQTSAGLVSYLAPPSEP